MTAEEIISDKCAPWYTDLYSSPLKKQVLEAMEEYAKQQALTFDVYKQEERWFSMHEGMWHQTFEHGTAMSKKTYNKYHTKTPEGLYDQFLANQIHNDKETN